MVAKIALATQIFDIVGADETLDEIVVVLQSQQLVLVVLPRLNLFLEDARGLALLL